MEAGKVSKGSGARRLKASSYLLELVPDFQGVDSWQHRLHGESLQFHMGRGDDAYRFQSFQDSIASSRSVHWVGVRDQIRDDYIPSSFVTKPRLSRPRHHSHMGIPDSIAPSEFIPQSSKDQVIFTESPVAPGVPVVYRSPEERSANQDRLNLDRRHLNVFPILEGEERLRLLNLQHNSITRLQHLSNLKRLVFLDLYDNLVHEITGVEGLVSLRVLMLGRNRIRKISGLQSLIKLDVLDLHGNMIREIEGLNHLIHLRVLNLAGNDITCVSGLAGLQALTELNLRRNRITHVYEMDELANLQRLFLSHNLIQNFDDIPCLSHCDNLTELTLDGNPLANAPDHRQSVIYHINQLCLLDQTPVSEEERKEALATSREEEERIKEEKRRALIDEQKDTTITTIRVQWEHAHQLNITKDVASGSDQDPLMSTSLLHASSPSPAQSYFLEHNGIVLSLYGWGALETMETSPSLHSKQPIQELHFHYIEFEDIAHWLPKIVISCPNVTSLVFNCTNMSGLEQINALAQLTTPLNSLTISSYGNPITYHPLFSSYTLYRLNHLGLSVLNGETITDKALVEAEQVFGRLGQLTTSHLPQARLLALIKHFRPRSNRKLTLNSTGVKSICLEPVNRVGLHHFSPDPDPLSVAQQERVSTARVFCDGLLSSTILTHKKVRSYDLLWPRVMARLVHNAVEECSNMDHHMKNLLDSL